MKIDEDVQNVLNEKVKSYEMAPIVRDRSGKHLIKSIFTTPDQDRNWYNEEYFKITDSLSFTGKERLARIKYREPKYVEHIGSNWNLNTKEKKDLISILSESCNKVPGISTVWQYAIYQFNMSAYEDSIQSDCLMTQKQLDELSEGDPRKKYLPIDLPMPDYTQL